MNIINTSGIYGAATDFSSLTPVIIVNTSGNYEPNIGGLAVTSFNNLTGPVVLGNGSGTTISTVGQTITVNVTPGAEVSGVQSLNTVVGALTLGGVANGNILVTTNTGTGAISLSGINYGFAGTSNSGILSSTDWNTFNSKQNALGFTPLNSTISGNINSNASGVYAIGNSNFPFSGVYLNSVYEGTRTIVTSYNANLLDTNIFTNQGSTITVGLPAGNPGKHYRIISIVASVTNNVILSGINCQIDGASTKTINSAALGGASNLISDGNSLWSMASLF